MDPTPARLDLGRLLDRPGPDLSDDDAQQLRQDFTRFMMRYKFGMDEIVTKLTILRDEFAHLHESNPIENISSRLKNPDSIIEKMRRKGCDPTFVSIGEKITDIAGVRVTCSFVSDVYHVFDMLTSQSDVVIVEVRDYITDPKPNGYRSLHALIEVPVFLSDGEVPALVEVQLRTIAMDFWASLEHKIYYKYAEAVPQSLLDGLREASVTAGELDATMERLHAEVKTSGALPHELKAELVDGTASDPDAAFVERLKRLGR
ncbi:GTP pyrophosphokinase [Aeromicrobium wangtongii]|uniref:GTP pyrophosphokinase n=1 Tax=Aeromicrobium wangtongii TaxID=2969247 RepID=UPI002016D5EA|nr:GTP pyrophosphokinase family protein [Aeromicrobium wangtongii]MCL3819474.1 GTP pyrophosphokinase family protein [Aeromicrobium wangtongii]